MEEKFFKALGTIGLMVTVFSFVMKEYVVTAIALIVTMFALYQTRGGGSGSGSG